MEDKNDVMQFVDIFLSYQAALDTQKKLIGDNRWLKGALESDKREQSPPRNSASSIPAN